MVIKAPDYDSKEFDACGNTVVAEIEYNNMIIPLCDDCLNSLRQSLKEYDETIFCHKCKCFIMSNSGWNYGGSCLKSIENPETFKKSDAGFINNKDCMDTCKDAILKEGLK